MLFVTLFVFGFAFEFEFEFVFLPPLVNLRVVLVRNALSMSLLPRLDPSASQGNFVGRWPR